MDDLLVMLGRCQSSSSTSSEFCLELKLYLECIRVQLEIKYYISLWQCNEQFLFKIQNQATILYIMEELAGFNSTPDLGNYKNNLKTSVSIS